MFKIQISSSPIFVLLEGDLFYRRTTSLRDSDLGRSTRVEAFWRYPRQYIF